ncbi:GNAT family N-acetyltransferase [Paenibacillus anaericanus]|uniref:GNAT family N-acetyltransferase n=1 Tax=Paenibacillus anaericanus TaxID=170367 RepID=A0A3S1DNI5_9BACL|nr:GNAT family N-acetyltransferase [Paenibacillus anaericanus]RUT41968.1 GNAT family N-acetyltransferase [Paenibacillus anaericanus]
MTYSNHLIHGNELTSESFSKTAGLFVNLKHHLSIKGVISGLIPGRVFLSNDGRTALLMNPQGFFLGGSPKNTLFFIEVNELLSKELLPSLATRGELDYVMFYPSNDDSWIEALELVTRTLLPLRSERMTLTFDMNNTPNTLNDYIVPVDASLLKRQDLIGLDDVISEIDGGWPSLEAFEDRGFGCVAIQSTDEGLTIISWCLTDWVVGSECEVGIQTEERYRGNGWARKTLLGALLLAKQKGITRVGWQCWSNNIGSQRTAMSVGFKPLADFPVLFGWNHPLNNFLVNGNYYMRGDIKYGSKDYARAAWSYAVALDKGWDWNGDATLYWNSACLFYLIGENDRAKQYYQKAIEKGWKNIHVPHYHEYVYREVDSEEIAGKLAEA